MIHFSTEKGFTHHIKGPTYEIMAETVLFVCATAQVISDGTGEPLTSVALDFIKAISGTLADDEQIERVKRNEAQIHITLSDRACGLAGEERPPRARGGAVIYYRGRRSSIAGGRRFPSRVRSVLPDGSDRKRNTFKSGCRPGGAQAGGMI